MLKIPGRYIGDTWYYVDDDTVHCYFLTQPDFTSLGERGLGICRTRYVQRHARGMAWA